MLLAVQREQAIVMSDCDDPNPLLFEEQECCIASEEKLREVEVNLLFIIMYNDSLGC